MARKVVRLAAHSSLTRNNTQDNGAAIAVRITNLSRHLAETCSVIALAACTNIAAGATVVGIGLLVDTRAATAALPCRTVTTVTAGTRPFNAGLPGGTDMPAGATVVGIRMQVHTGTVAVPQTCCTADTLFTTCACATHIPTSTAVVVVIVGVDAGAVANDVAPGAAANALTTTCPVRADVPTGPTVVNISV